MKNNKLHNIFKYLLQFTIVIMATKYLPSTEFTFKEILIIAIVCAIIFATLDIYSSSLSHIGQHQLVYIIGFTTLLA